MVVLLVVLVVLVGLAGCAWRFGHRVPRDHVGVVLRDGVYVRLVTPGLLWLPASERVSPVPTLVQHVRVDDTALATADGATVRADLRVAYRVEDPVRALSAVHDAAYAVERDALEALRVLAARTPAADLVSGSVRATAHVRETTGPHLRGWGLEPVDVEVVVRSGGR